MKLSISSPALSVLALATVVLLVSGCSKPAEPPASAPAASTSVGTAIDDTVVTTAVKSALVADAEVKGFDIKVETRKGEVQLSGFVDNQTQIDRALEITRAVAGVLGVQNKVALKDGPTTVGVKVDDSIMTARVKAALLADEMVKSFDIAVATRSGEVQLSGFVDSQNQVDRAVLIAKGVQGVGAVINEMSIKK